MSEPPPLPRSVQTQPERLILITSAALAMMALFLVLLAGAGLPVWACVWKSCTGMPCAGCGGTRSLILMLSGEWFDALRMNPGAVLGVAGLSLIATYSAAVLVFRLPPWRPAWLARVTWRRIVVAALLANWIYLLWDGRA